MTRRPKRSTPRPPDLDDAMDHAADGSTVSARLAKTSARGLKLDAGRRAIAAWQQEHGALTADELAEGLDRARRLLGRTSDRPASSPSPMPFARGWS